MKIDILTWLMPKSGQFVRSVFVRLLPDGRTAFYFIKQAQGYPNDIKVVDDNYAYFRYTDFPKSGGGNGTPQCYRYYATPIPIFNRFFDPLSFSPPGNRIPVVAAFTTNIQKYTDCSTWTPGNLGPVETWMRFEPSFNFGGQLGIKPSIIGEYYYTKQKDGLWHTYEEFPLCEGSSWCAWNRWDRDVNNVFQLTSSIAFNNYIPDTLQVPVVPCNIVL